MRRLVLFSFLVVSCRCGEPVPPAAPALLATHTVAPPAAHHVRALGFASDGGLVVRYDANEASSKAMLRRVAPDGTLRSERALPSDSSVAIGPSGRRIAVAEGTSVVVESAIEPTREARVPGLQRAVALAFAPNEAIVATADVDGRIRWIDPLNGLVQAVVETGCEEPSSLAFDASGTALEMRTARGACTYDASRDEVEKRSSPPEANEVVRVPDRDLEGRWDADGAARLFDPVTSRDVARRPSEPLRKAVKWAFAPDGSAWALALSDGTIELGALDGIALEPPHRPPALVPDQHKGSRTLPAGVIRVDSERAPFGAVTWLPGTPAVLAIAAGAASETFDLASGRRSGAIVSEGSAVLRVAPIAGGFAHAHAHGTLSLATSGMPKPVVAHAGPMRLSASRDGRRVMTCAGSLVRVWQLEAAGPKLEYELSFEPGVVSSAFVDGDRGGMALTVAGELVRWDHRRRPGVVATISGAVDAAWSFDGRRVAIAATEVSIHDATTGAKLDQQPLGQVPHGITWRPDGRALALLVDDGVAVWRLGGDGLARRRTGLRCPSTALAYDPTSARLAVSGPCGIVVVEGE